MMRSIHKLSPRRAAAVVLLATLAALPNGALAQPSEAMLRVEVESFQALSADVSALGTHIRQPMISMGLLGIGEAIGAPGLVGIDPARPWRIVGFADPANLETFEIVFILPVQEDGAGYLESLGVSYATVQDDGVMRRLRAERRVTFLDEFSLQFVEGYAVASRSAPLTTRVAEDLAQDPQAYAVRGFSGTVRASVETPLLLTGMQDFFEQQQMMLEAVGDDAAAGLAVAAHMQRMAHDIQLRILKQTARIGLGFQCDAAGLTLYQRIDAIPERRLSRIFADSVPVDPRLGALLPATANLVYVSGAAGAWMRHGIDPYTQFMREFFELQAQLLEQAGEPMPGMPPTELFDAMLDDMREMIELYGDQMALAFGPTAEDEPIAYVQVMTLRDPDAYQLKSAETFARTTAMQREAGLPFRLEKDEPREAHGVTIDSYRLVIDAPDEGDLAREFWQDLEDAPEKLLLWMREGRMEIAVVDDLLLTSIGLPGSLDGPLQRLRLRTRDVWTERYAALFPEVGNRDRATDWWILKPLALFKQIAALFDEEGEFAEALAQLPDEGPGLGGLTLSNPTASVDATRISSATLSAIATSIRQWMTVLGAVRQQPRTPGAQAEPPMGAPVEVILPEDLP